LRRVASQSGLEHSRTRMDIPEQAPNGAFENSPGIDPRVEGTRDITPFPSAEGGRPPRGGREEIESSRPFTRPWKDRAIFVASLRDGMHHSTARERWHTTVVRVQKDRFLTLDLASQRKGQAGAGLNRGRFLTGAALKKALPTHVLTHVPETCPRRRRHATRRGQATQGYAPTYLA
jgi:hypothetical protein